MTTPVRLSRDRLYMEVWRRPIGHIARELRVTSARLRAACKELNVLLPSLGHWATLRAGNALPAPALPAHNGPTSVMLDSNPRESLAEWVSRADIPATPKKERKVIAPPKSASPSQPRYVPLSVWAAAVFGEHAPHNNTLLRWVHDGRIHPPAKKMARAWWVAPDAEYICD